MFVRHEKIESLEKLKETCIYLRHSITALSQDVYSSHVNVMRGSGKKASAEKIQKNSEKSFFLQPIPDDKLPKGATNGHFLSGEISFFKNAEASKVDNYKILYQINNHGKKVEKHGSKKCDSNEAKLKSEDEKLNETIRDTRVSSVQKIDSIFESVRNEYPDHVPVYINRILYLEKQFSALKKEEIEKKKQNLNDRISLANTGIEKINQDNLLKYIGQKHHELDEEKK